MISYLYAEQFSATRGDGGFSGDVQRINYEALSHEYFIFAAMISIQYLKA